MTHRCFKDLNKRTIADKVLCHILINPKYDRYQRGLASMIYEFLFKKCSSGTVKNEIISNNELGEELHKSVIRKSEGKNTLTFYS